MMSPIAVHVGNVHAFKTSIDIDLTNKVVD